MPTTQSRSALTFTAILAAAATSLVSVSLLSLHRRRRKVADARSSSGELNRDESLEYPPTPPTRHWLFGHALSLQPKAGQPKESHYLLFLEWMQKLSSKMVMFQLPVIGRFIVVGDAEVARHVLTDKSFHKSPTYKGMLPLIGKKSMVAAEGKEWVSQRRLYNPGFSPDFLRTVVSTIILKCNRFIAKCDEDIENDVATDMLGRAVDLTSDVIASVAFGEDWGIHDPSNENIRTLKTIRDLTVVVGENMSNPLKRYFNLSNMWKTWRLSVTLDRDMQRLVQRRLEKFRASPDMEMKQKDILSLTLSSVLRSKKTSDPDKDTSFTGDDMENMTSQLKTFYFAGHDTTATTIAWAYWLLCQYPKSLKRAREEVISSLGTYWAEDAALGKNLSTTTYEKLQQCEYLDAVARETLRLYPPAASTRYAVDPNANAEGVLLGNSIVHLNFYAIQRDPDIWEESNKFMPERFLGEEGRKRASSFSFLPFSKGSRDCIGKYFALLETKIALAAMISRYDGVAVDTNEVYTTRLTSIPIDGCKVNLQRRSTD
jgi:cytochrome P450